MGGAIPAPCEGEDQTEFINKTRRLEEKEVLQAKVNKLVDSNNSTFKIRLKSITLSRGRTQDSQEVKFVGWAGSGLGLGVGERERDVVSRLRPLLQTPHGGRLGCLHTLGCHVPESEAS